MKILIIYGSTTGMTEMASEEVEKGLIEAGHEIERKNVTESTIKDLDSYQYIVFGSSTWDFGCLQYDFETFHDEMKQYDFKGKKIAIFGTGDKAYGDTYCEALRIIHKTVLDQGGEIIIEDKDIEHDMTDERLAEVREWGGKLGEAIAHRV